MIQLCQTCCIFLLDSGLKFGQNTQTTYFVVLQGLFQCVFCNVNLNTVFAASVCSKSCQMSELGQSAKCCYTCGLYCFVLNLDADGWVSSPHSIYNSNSKKAGMLCKIYKKQNAMNCKSNKPISYSQ